jgi:predicted TPR repeat methyltransferase
MDQHPITVEPSALSRRVRELIAAGRPGAARPLLAALRRMLPPSPVLAELAARLALLEQQPEHALAELNAALAEDAAAPSLRKLRADLRWQRGDGAGALQDAAEAVLLDPTDPAAKGLLGLLLIDADRTEEARICLQEAMAAQPLDPTYRQALARALEQTGQPQPALSVLEDGILLAPGVVALRNAAMCLAVRQRDFATAVQLGEAAQCAGIVDACTFGLLGHARSSLGAHAAAAEAYAEALKLGPDDAYVRHLVAASGAVPGAPRAPTEYLRAVFDGYAERFDIHLISLGYRGPGLVRAALLRELPGLAEGSPAGPLLDLGCGTGLVAVALSDLPIAPLHGVDLSPRMLEHAAAKGLYAELSEAEIVDALAEELRRYPIVVAADLLCYFGELELLFASVRERLAPGGLFVATAEAMPDRPAASQSYAPPNSAGWQLGATGRYAHAAQYLTNVAAAAGLQLRSLARDTIRHELDQPVPGLIAVLARPAHD